MLECLLPTLMFVCRTDAKTTGTFEDLHTEGRVHFWLALLPKISICVYDCPIPSHPLKIHCALICSPSNDMMSAPAISDQPPVWCEGGYRQWGESHQLVTKVQLSPSFFTFCLLSCRHVWVWQCHFNPQTKISDFTFETFQNLISSQGDKQTATQRIHQHPYYPSVSQLPGRHCWSPLWITRVEHNVKTITVYFVSDSWV